MNGRLCYQDQIDDNEVTQGVRAPISGVGNTLDGGGGVSWRREGASCRSLRTVYEHVNSFLWDSYISA